MDPRRWETYVLLLSLECSMRVLVGSVRSVLSQVLGLGMTSVTTLLILTCTFWPHVAHCNRLPVL